MRDRCSPSSSAIRLCAAASRSTRSAARALLLSDLSTGVTGDIHFVDFGYNIITMPHPSTLNNGTDADGINGEPAEDAAQRFNAPRCRSPARSTSKCATSG